MIGRVGRLGEEAGRWAFAPYLRAEALENIAPLPRALHQGREGGMKRSATHIQADHYFGREDGV